MFLLLPKNQKRLGKRTRRVFWAAALVIVTLTVLRFCGLYRRLDAPAGSMEPAICPGDQLMMEGFTYWRRNPRRGDLAVFKTDGIMGVPPGQIWVKRIAGEPGEKLRISEGQLYINDESVALSNAVGRIIYDPPIGAEGFPSFSGTNTVTVPGESYFVLGDNSTNSFDSRIWGPVPRENIIGRIWFCYQPSERSGIVK